MRAVQSSYLEQRIAGPAEYLLYIGIVVPAVYAFVVSYSALVFPHWDHVNLARYILGYYDGTLHFSIFLPRRRNPARSFPARSCC